MDTPHHIVFKMDREDVCSAAALCRVREGEGIWKFFNLKVRYQWFDTARHPAHPGNLETFTGDGPMDVGTWLQPLLDVTEKKPPTAVSM